MVLIVVSSTVFQCNSWALFRVWFQCGFSVDSSVVLSVVPVRFPVRF